MHRLLLSLALAALVLPTAALAEGGDWYADFDEAVKVAKEEGKDLLIDFTGSDWCGWCKKLHAEVFAHDAFLTAAKGKYVLVALDFPRSEEAKAKVPNPARNQELQQKYGVRGFPTIMLMDVEGNVYGKTGYQQGGPEAYVKHLEEMRTKFRPGLAKAIEMSRTVAAAEGEAKTAAIGDALAMIEELKGAPYVSALVPAAKAALEIDPDNALGLRNRAMKALIVSGNADTEVVVAAAAADPKNEAGLLEHCVLAGCSLVRSKEQLPAALEKIDALLALDNVQDKDVHIKLLANAAFWNFRHLGNPEKAKEYATKLKALDPEAPGIQNLLKQILGE